MIPNLVLGKDMTKMSNFVILVSIGVCGLNIKVVLEMHPIFVQKILNSTKFGIE